jgi:hypothetical protein
VLSQRVEVLSIMLEPLYPSGQDRGALAKLLEALVHFASNETEYVHFNPSGFSPPSEGHDNHPPTAIIHCATIALCCRARVSMLPYAW